MSMKLAVRVPAGMSPGQTVTFPSTSGGQMFTTVIPVGVEAGQTFVVEVPQQEPPPTPPPDVPMGLPVSPMRSRSLRAPRAPVASTAPLDTATGASPVAPTWQDGQALRHAECPICFEPLASGPVGVFLAGGRRVSNHFFNLGAAQEWLRSGNGSRFAEIRRDSPRFAEIRLSGRRGAPARGRAEGRPLLRTFSDPSPCSSEPFSEPSCRHCPLTRLPISSVLAVPDLRADLQAWWRVVDVNGDGRLSRHELIEALKAQLLMRRRLVGRALLGTGSPNLRCRRSCRSTPRSWMTHWPTRRIGCGSSGTRTALPPLSCPANRHAAALALASSLPAALAAALAAAAFVTTVSAAALAPAALIADPVFASTLSPSPRTRSGSLPM